MAIKSILQRKFGASQRLLMLGLAVTLSFSAICSAILWKMGDNDREHARLAATNLVASIAADIDRNIELYDLSLQAVVDGLKLPELERVSPQLRQVVLFDRAATAKDLGGMLVLNATGQVVLDSQSLAPRDANYSHHDFFSAHQYNSHAGLFFSRMWVSHDGQYLISFSRRITNADGSFGGVVVGNMRLTYFNGLFKALQFGPNDAISIVSTGGTMLMRAPFDINAIGQNLGKAMLFEKFRASPAGSYTTASALDKVVRLFVYQQVGERPLMIVNGVSLQTIYANWWHEVVLIGSLVLVLCAIAMGLIVVLMKAWKQKNIAENRLALLATTDGLTGLSNRRRFDEALAGEWLRSQRSQAPVSLLMIDADSFKAYNDTFGHQAGDTALVAIAQCVAGGAKRSVDVAARFGGEEFAVLLPGVALDGAFHVAEEIRASVLSLRAQQVGRADLTPTVSVGVACMIPQAGLSSADLLKSADLALYEAKHQGRNRSVTAAAAPLKNQMKLVA